MNKNKSILEQEEEFIKLNAEIDSETKALMSQVDQIKETRLTDQKLYSDWTISEPITQIEKLRGKENIQETESEFDSVNKAQDNSSAATEYLLRIKDENSTDCFQKENYSEELKELDLKKNQSQRISKARHSAKIIPSLVSTQEEEFTLSLGITRHKSHVNLKQGKPENDVIPETLKGVGHDGINRFLSAKVKLLTEQLEHLQKDGKKHLEKIKELQTHKDRAAEEKEKLIQQINMSKNVLIKYEKHADSIKAQFQTVQTENNHLKKELETFKKEIRQNTKNQNANEIKLNRTLEEVEKLKATLQQTKQEEKEFKEIQRKKIEDLSSTVKTLDRQKTELLNGFKKQLVIIDNLKRQRDLVEAGKLLKSSEDDFLNFLDCNPPNTVRHVNPIKSSKS